MVTSAGNFNYIVAFQTLNKQRSLSKLDLLVIYTQLTVLIITVTKHLASSGYESRVVCSTAYISNNHIEA